MRLAVDEKRTRRSTHPGFLPKIHRQTTARWALSNIGWNAGAAEAGYWLFGQPRRSLAAMVVVGMPGSMTSVFNRPYDFEHAFRNEACFRLFTTSYGQFRARLTQVELLQSRLSAIEREPSADWLLDGVPAHKVLVLLPIGDRPAPIWSGITPLQGEFMTFGPGHRMHVRTHGPCNWGAIWLAAQDLAGDTSTTLLANTLAIPTAAHRWRPQRTAGRRLRQLHTAAIRAAEVRPYTIVDAEAAHGMEQQLFDAVVDCLSTALPKPITQATHRHQELATQFERLLLAQPDGRDVGARAQCGIEHFPASSTDVL